MLTVKIYHIKTNIRRMDKIKDPTMLPIWNSNQRQVGSKKT